MFRDMAPELEFFRWRDSLILLPKMFFSDAPSFPQREAAQEKFFQESGRIPLDSPKKVRRRLQQQAISFEYS